MSLVFAALMFVPIGFLIGWLARGWFERWFERAMRSLRVGDVVTWRAHGWTHRGVFKAWREGYNGPQAQMVIELLDGTGESVRVDTSDVSLVREVAPTETPTTYRDRA